MSLNPSQIRANRGTDITFSFTWLDDQGDAVDLTGWSISTMDVSAEIVNFLTVEITNPSVGLISGRIEWDDSLLARVAYEFRIQLTLGSEDVSTNLIQVVYR